MTAAPLPAEGQPEEPALRLTSWRAELAAEQARRAAEKHSRTGRLWRRRRGAPSTPTASDAATRTNGGESAPGGVS